MKLPEFVENRQDLWDELEALLGRAGRRPERLAPAEIHRLTRLYRSSTADLAAARRLFPGDPVVDRLERLVVRARAMVFQGSGRRIGLVAFFTETYWRLIYERRRPLALAALLLMLPALLGAGWAIGDPDSLKAQLPAEFLWVTEASSTDQGYGAAGLIGFSAFVLSNNIRVALAAFALGLTWGIGTGWIIAQNGVIFGALTALAVGAGNWKLFLAAVMAHGVLEFSCVLVAGAAGLSLGRSMLRPGRLTRRESLAREAGESVKIALGTAVWLVVAGFIEGFASRTGVGWLPTTLMGLFIGGIFWFLVWWQGGRAADALSESL